MDRLMHPDYPGECQDDRGEPCCPDENCDEACLQRRLDKLAYYERVEAENRMHILPEGICIGAEVWAIDRYARKPKVVKRKIEEIKLNNRAPLLIFGRTLFASLVDLGKYLFLANEKEKADAALQAYLEREAARKASEENGWWKK